MTADRYQLAREFETMVMCDRINRLTDIDEVKEIAVRLAKLNFQMKDTVKAMINQGWLPNDPSFSQSE